MNEIFKNDLFEFDKSNRIYLETERLKIQGKFQESQDILNSIMNNSIHLIANIKIILKYYACLQEF